MRTVTDNTSKRQTALIIMLLLVVALTTTVRMVCALLLRVRLANESAQRRQARASRNSSPHIEPLGPPEWVTAPLAEDGRRGYFYPVDASEKKGD
jgi:flagellar basal body-associated protein FliL